MRLIRLSAKRRALYIYTCPPQRLSQFSVWAHPDKHCDATELQGAHASDHGRRLGVEESTEKEGTSQPWLELKNQW
jgi:hypothetical protein